MPITPPNLTTSIAGGLVSSGLLGVAVPQLALGVATGVHLWLQQAVVQTVDVGTLGAGTGTLPFLVPAPMLIGALLANYPANSHIGPMAPLEATGLGNGLSIGFAQGLILTAHPGVGVGTGVARLVGPPAFPSLVAGFASAGMSGPGAAFKANAISMALVTVFAAFQIPVPIVGPASPTGGSGVGVGKIV